MATPYLRENPLVFVEDLESPLLSERDLHHMKGPLRLRSGANIVLSDGAGSWRTATFDLGLSGSVLPVGPIVVDPEPSWPISVAFAPTKRQKPEWVVRKLTELGVDLVVPVICQRSVVRWDKSRVERLTPKLQITAREAAMQCRRLRLPAIAAPLSFAELVKSTDAVFALADPGGARLGKDQRMIVIGPEGGFAPEELSNQQRVALGQNILRAETAALTAATLMAHMRDLEDQKPSYKADFR